MSTSVGVQSRERGTPLAKSQQVRAVAVRETQPTLAPGGLTPPSGAPVVGFFVPAQLHNPLNGRRHWRTVARWAKDLRERSHLCALTAARLGPTLPYMYPKRVGLKAQTFNRFDQDGLRAALKPLVDGLVDAKLLAGDAPGHGNEFAYEQTINRKERGVWVTVAVR